MSDASEPAEYASPPCFMHELTPEYRERADRSDAQPQTWDQIDQWRKAERKRLLEDRQALAQGDRQARSDRIAHRLDQAIGKVSGLLVGGYWPIRGEPDLRNWAIRVI